MHGAHHYDLLHAALNHGLNKGVVFRKIGYMSIGIMNEAIMPCKMQENIRFPKTPPGILLFKYISSYPLRSFIYPLCLSSYGFNGLVVVE